MTTRRRVRLVVLVLQLAARCALGAPVESDLTWREKREERKLREEVVAIDRYVDCGVILRVVVADPEGEELLGAGKPRLRVIREHGPFGGVIDTRSNPPTRIGRSLAPIVWLCSEDQEQILLHDDPQTLGQLIFGSEGAGKTRVLAMLHYFWWIELIGQRREVGQTAPTKKRLKMVLEAMTELYPSAWFTYQKADQLLTFCDGHRVQFVSTKKQSEAQGSPAQGFNWSRGGRDEFQDQIDADEDIESRGRAAPVVDGVLQFKQAATCTAKQSAEFRDRVAVKLNSGTWIKRLLLIERSPFIPPSFLEQKRLVMTDREFRRRYKAEDLPPEHMVYFNWSRETNLRARPQTEGRGATARKITSIVLRLKTGNPQHAMLVGHDPGTAKSASIILDAYRLEGIADPCWWVRGELFTMHRTTEQHAVDLLELVQQRFAMNLPRRPERVHVRAHPFGQAKNKPSVDVYRIFRRIGLDIDSAQYTKKGQGTGLIPLESRLEMINTLLCDASGRRRLFVDVDEHGLPVAPRLVTAFETMERDELGQAETEDKTLEQDYSDPPAALGYALWPWEKEAAAWLRVKQQQRSAA